MTSYHLLAADGRVISFGVEFSASTDVPSGRTWVGLCSWPEGGLVAVSSDGSVAFLAGALPLNEMGQTIAGMPAIDIAVAGHRRGFWVLDAVGGVFTLGDAPYCGSIPELGDSVRTAPIVSFSSTPTGLGYWILDRAGTVYPFGDAQFYGSVSQLSLAVPPGPAVDLVSTPTGEGYAILESDGALRSFGDAVVPGLMNLGREIAAVAFAPAGRSGSYLLVDRRGFVFPVRNAPMLGSAAHLELAAPIVDIAVSLGSDLSR